MSKVEKIHVVQTFFVDKETKREDHSGRPRVFFNGNSLERANAYVEEMARINDYMEIPKTDFNDRLFVKKFRFNTDATYMELYEIGSDHHVHDCSPDAPKPIWYNLKEKEAYEASFKGEEYIPEWTVTMELKWFREGNETKGLHVPDFYDDRMHVLKQKWITVDGKEEWRLIGKEYVT